MGADSNWCGGARTQEKAFWDQVEKAVRRAQAEGRAG